MATLGFGNGTLGLLLGVFVLTIFATSRSEELNHLDLEADINFEEEGLLAEIMPDTRPFNTTLHDSRNGTDETVPLQSSVGGDQKMPTVSETNVSAIYLHQNDNDRGEKVPPYILNPLSQERVIVPEIKFKGFTVNCEASGYPRPTFEWYRDDQRLDDTGSLVKAFPNGTLYFTDMLKRDNGLYQCFASNDFGKAVSVKVPIVAVQEPTAPVDDKTQDFWFTEGEPASVNCSNTPPTIPEYSKRWYENVGSKEFPMNERIGTQLSGIMRFAYIIPTDARTYSCGLAPQDAKLNSLIRFYNGAQIKVYSKDKVEVPPRVQYASHNVKARIGQNVTLECFFSGFPVPTITWKNDSQHVIGPRDPHLVISDFGRKMSIIAVRQGDEGMYSCEADNKIGGSTVAYINVNVTSPPQRNFGLSALTVPDDREVTLNCSAKAATHEQLDTPKWYRNGQLFTQSNANFDPQRYRFSSDLTQLHITNLQKERDTAAFQCNITNSEGYLFYTGYLRVIEAIVITRQPPVTIKISPNNNSTHDISVFATGDECCQMRKHWQFNEKNMDHAVLDTPPFIYREANDTLLFHPSSVSNETLSKWFGNYSCRVSSPHDEKTIYFSIALENTESNVSPQVAEKAEVSLWWIAIVAGLIVVLLAIIIIVVIRKTNYPKSTYQLEKTELRHHLNPEKDLLDQSFQEI